MARLVAGVMKEPRGKQFLLARRFRADYGDKVELEQSGSIEVRFVDDWRTAGEAAPAAQWSDPSSTAGPAAQHPGGGTRWRKTTLVMSIAVRAGLRGKVVLWGAPVYDACRIGWGEALHALGSVATANASRMELSLPNSGRIIFRSLDDPDNAEVILLTAWSSTKRPTSGESLVRGGTPDAYRHWRWAGSLGRRTDATGTGRSG